MMYDFTSHNLHSGEQISLGPAMHWAVIVQVILLLVGLVQPEAGQWFLDNAY